MDLFGGLSFMEGYHLTTAQITAFGQCPREEEREENQRFRNFLTLIYYEMGIPDELFGLY